MEINDSNLKFDAQRNRLVITIDENEILITADAIRDLMPVKDEKQKVEDLKMVLHDIEMEQLTKMNFYIKTMKELDDGIVKATDKLREAEDMIQIKKWQAVIKSYVDRKNALAEIRRAVGLLEKYKKEIRVRIAKLEVAE
jgi:hypothetical protein